MRKLWLGLIILMAIIYIFFIPDEPVGVKIAMKIIPMMLIIGFAWSGEWCLSSRYQKTLIAGLAVSMVADGVIYWFMAGLVTFFIAHLLYIRAFRLERRGPVPLPAAAVLVLYGIFIAVWIAVPRIMDGETILGVAVLAYITVILIMGWEAIRTRSALIIAGALLFIISDSFLAIDRFVIDLPARDALVMVTYYAAQILFALSVSSRRGR